MLAFAASSLISVPARLRPAIFPETALPLPTFDALWQHLDTATRSRSPCNFLQLATAGLDGAPQVRTVVLRQADRQAGSLSFVTDMRSPKVAEIGRDPRVSLLCYDPAANTQLRLSGTASLLREDAERRAFWQSLRGRTLALFEAPHAPGTEIGEDGQPLLQEQPREPDADPFERFQPVTVTLSRLEWLDLSAEPHLRCLYRRTDDGGWKGTRLSP